MRKFLFSVLAIATLAGTGCHHNLRKHGCQTCKAPEGAVCGCNAGHGHGGLHGRHRGGGPGPEAMGMGGPPTGAVAYPYYTTRGPRDFFTNNPPSIGP